MPDAARFGQDVTDMRDVLGRLGTSTDILKMSALSGNVPTERPATNAQQNRWFGRAHDGRDATDRGH